MPAIDAWTKRAMIERSIDIESANGPGIREERHDMVRRPAATGRYRVAPNRRYARNPSQGRA